MNTKVIRNLFYHIWPFLFLGLLLVILFWQVFFKGYVFIDGDNFHLNIPLKYFLVDALSHGYFPFWNPYVLGGMPYAAVINLAVFNWLNVLYVFFPVPRALTVQVIVDLFLIGSFHFLFLRSKQMSKVVSLIGGVIFMLSGTVFAFVDHVAILDTIVYIPVLFLLFGLFFRKNKLRFLFLGILAQFLQILSGHPQITYYTIFFILLYILFQRQLSLGMRLKYGLVYILFSIGLASFQLVPFVELVLRANRPVGSLSYATSGSFDFAHLLTIFFPTFFGTKLLGNWWGSQTMLVGYIGVAPLLFLFLGIRYAKFREKTYFLFGLILSFVLSLGKVGLIYFLFYFFVPGWSSFRSPFDLFIFTTFFATLFVAQGLEIAIKKNNSFNFLGKKIGIVSSILLAFSILILVLTNTVTSWTRIGIFLSAYQVPVVSKILFYDPSKIQEVATWINGNVGFFLLFTFLTGCIIWKFLKYKIVSFIFLVCIAINLLIINFSYLQFAPLKFYNRILPSSLYASKSGMYRVFAKETSVKQDRKFLPGPNFFYDEGERNMIGITDNRAVPLKIYSITGYSSLILKNYAAFLSSENITGITQSSITSQMLNELGAKYILNVNPDASLSVTENSSALPRVRLLDTNGMVRILQMKPNSITLSVQSKKENTVILADSYYPGWKAYVNGKEMIIQTYHHMFRSVSVPSGFSTVIFVYDPLSWKVGLALFFFFLAVLGISIYRFKKYV